jgi:uncharacterized protein (TIGR04255 family)
LRPFITPLFEVTAELNLAPEIVAEFRGRTFYSRIQSRFHQVNQFPMFLASPDQLNADALKVTRPLYRFSSPDSGQAVFLSHRMVAANQRGWNGYENFRIFVSEMVSSFLELMTPVRVERQSLGFYNRVPISSLEELREVVKVPFDLRGDVSLYELMNQSARMTEWGSVLTQLFMMPPDEFTSEPFLAINNILRFVVPDSASVSAESFLNWMDAGHDFCRDLIWSTLSEAAQLSWKQTYAK